MRRQETSSRGNLSLVNSQLLVGDGWPRSVEVAALVRRVGAIDWFRRAATARDPSHRIARCLADHMQGLGAPAPTSVDIQRPWEGRADLRGQDIDLSRPTWDGLLQARFEEVCDAIRSSGRARGHSLVVVSGEALLMRPDALPVQQETLWTRLAGPRDDSLPESTVRALVDRVLWELGMMVLWEMVGDLIGDNPYAPLLAIYEEGLYPLDITPGGPARLWAPH